MRRRNILKMLLWAPFISVERKTRDKKKKKRNYQCARCRHSGFCSFEYFCRTEQEGEVYRETFGGGLVYFPEWANGQPYWLKYGRQEEIKQALKGKQTNP